MIALDPWIERLGGALIAAGLTLAAVVRTVGVLA